MTVCVHGLGYVGLATASLFANNGRDVVGFDTDPTVVSRLQRGEVDVPEEELERFVRQALSDGLSVSNEIQEAEYHMLCVPTPYSDSADLSYVEQAADAISRHLRAGDTVVVESTVPPGTTSSTVAELLAQSGLTAGQQFHLAYSPETILPGNTVPELRTNDRIIGGIDDSSSSVVTDLYESAIEGDIHVAPDATTAEFVKLVQNAFRDVNIAFANELALLANDYEVDAREAIRMANSHPRVDILNPGPGVGGHCIPVDPLFLTDSSDRATLVGCARGVNDGMPAHIADRLRDELGGLAGTKIAILGVAYKGNVAETRNSPGRALARTLKNATVGPAPITDGGRGEVTVSLTDPRVNDPTLALVPQDEALRDADAAVITAAHDEYRSLDPAGVRELLRTNLILDPVDVLDNSRWQKHGVRVIDL